MSQPSLSIVERDADDASNMSPDAPAKGHEINPRTQLEDTTPPTPKEKAAALRLNLLRVGSIAHNFEDASPMYKLSSEKSASNVFSDYADEEDNNAKPDASPRSSASSSPISRLQSPQPPEATSITFTKTLIFAGPRGHRSPGS